ncbi:MAG: membrane protein of unknown function [Promethearchaeota archaeon]|nr:MAG: membrane protein of unknown function [Candidatus Lokiarchaeota archaeon]
MERPNEFKTRELKAGIPLSIIGIMGMFLVFFLLAVPNLIIFLLSFYPFLIAFILGILYILSGLNKLIISNAKLMIIAIIAIGAFFVTLGLDLMVPWIIKTI